MRRELTAILLTGVLVSATACTSDSHDTRDDRADINAKAYVDDYESEQSEGGSLLTTQEKSSAAAPDSSGSERVEPCDDCHPLPRPVPPIDTDNTFRDAGTSPMLDPARQPQSTFGLDVDTGSHRVASHLLDRGVLPPPASVRPEEWINAYSYDDPAPKDSDLGLSVDSGNSSNDSTQTYRIGVSARELNEQNRPPASLTFVIDTSGSMDIRERLGLAKSSLALLAKNLRPDDKIAIVTYEEEARGVLKPTPVSETDKILDAIDSLQPGGGTNLESGVDLGYKYAARAAKPDGINAVVLASDGVANIGLTDPSGLANQVNAAAAKDDIHLVTVGYGMGNYNDHLMEQLANQGQGFYSYVSTYDDARQLFVEDLTSTLSVVASDAKAQVEFDPKAVDSYRLIGYENRSLDAKDFDDASVDAGEVGAGMSVSAVYEVTPSANAQPGDRLGTAAVRWQPDTDGRTKEVATPLELAESSGSSSDSLRLATTVAEFAETIKHQQGKKELDQRLHQLEHTATDLDDSGVPGAGKLRSMIQAAIDARPAGGGEYEIQ